MSVGFFLANTSTHSLDTDISESEFGPDIDFSELPPIDYETLNESWYNPNIEMIIVVPDGNQDFIDAIQPLCDWKNEKGVKTIVLSNYSLYPGKDDAERIRNMIKFYYESDGIRWVLLAGDAQEDLIPIRYVYNPDTVIATREFEGTYTEYNNWDGNYKPTDYYYAALEGTWDQDGDERFGESAQFNTNGVDEIDWTPEVYVGRLPANTDADLEDMINKIMAYEKGLYAGDWMNQMLLAGGVSDTCGQEPPDGEDEARLTEYIWKNYVQSEMNFTHLYKTTDFSVDTNVVPPDEVIELTSNNFADYFNTGYSTVIFAGHGSPYRFDDNVLSKIYLDTEAQLCNNLNNPSLLYADACTTSSYDKNDGNIGEILISHQNRGAIGYIGALRVTWYSLNDYDLEILNRGNAKLFWKVFFEENKYQQGRALYDSKMAYMNSIYFQVFSSIQKEWERKNLLTYNLLGDPETDIYTNTPIEVKTGIVPNSVYGGELVSLNITNKREKVVPYARVHITTEDGIYHTIYADENGIVKFRVPHSPDKIYNLTISGHNLIPTNFSFSTISDGNNPDILDYVCIPAKPSINTNLNFDITTQDNETGIESVFVIFSINNFENYFYYQAKNEYIQNENQFNLLIDKLDPGKYQYCIYIRDYTNNSNMLYKTSFSFQIANPITDYYLIGGIFTIGAVSIVSSFMGFVGIKRYPKHIEKSKRT
jgi:hypothetical protein